MEANSPTTFLVEFGVSLSWIFLFIFIGIHRETALYIVEVEAV